MYFANPTGGAVAEMREGRIGFIDTPKQGNKRPHGVVWCADNGCFGKGYEESHWWAWLEGNAADAQSCMFATAPDVVGDAAATLERATPWLPRIRALGYPAAFVAQDGQENLPLPWDMFDVLFIGGTTAWKLSPATVALAAEAKRRGKRVHCGRVNSYKRFRWAEAIGCDSCDGTYLTFGPDVNLPKLMRWVDDLNAQPAMFGVNQ